MEEGYRKPTTYKVAHSKNCGVGKLEAKQFSITNSESGGADQRRVNISSCAICKEKLLQQFNRVNKTQGQGESVYNLLRKNCS